MENSLQTPSGYPELLQELKSRIERAQVRAAFAVSRELVLLYWSIGRDILARQGTEGWGAKVIDRLSHDLQIEFPGRRRLQPAQPQVYAVLCRGLAGAANSAAGCCTIALGPPYGASGPAQGSALREWYLRAAVEYGWSRNVMVLQIKSGLHEREGKALTNFQRALPPPDSDLAEQILKDPYNFDFLTVTKKAHEREIERGLLNHLRDLLLELGRGFSFVGSQVPLEVGGETFYLDLLFYHVRLHCYFVIELKIGKFKPEWAGKLNFYLSAVDGILRTPAGCPDHRASALRDP